MRFVEALTLKKGDLVIISDNQSKVYAGMVLEIVSIEPVRHWCCYAELKQPGFDEGFCIKKYDTRRLQRWSP